MTEVVLPSAAALRSPPSTKRSLFIGKCLLFLLAKVLGRGRPQGSLLCMTTKIWDEGDRKGPHPTSTSTPSPTMITESTCYLNACHMLTTMYETHRAGVKTHALMKKVENRSIRPLFHT